MQGLIDSALLVRHMDIAVQLSRILDTFIEYSIFQEYNSPCDIIADIERPWNIVRSVRRTHCCRTTY